MTQFFDFQKNILFGGKIQNDHRTDSPSPIFPHISRTRWDILKFQTASVHVSYLLGDTIRWFSKTYHVLRENQRLPPYRLTISDFPHISRIRWYILKFQTASVQASCFLGDTILWFWKYILFCEKKTDLRTYVRKDLLFQISLISREIDEIL